MPFDYDVRAFQNLLSPSRFPSASPRTHVALVTTAVSAGVAHNLPYG
jgi:hypothetical protein